MGKNRIDVQKNWSLLKDQILANTSSNVGTQPTAIKGFAFHRFAGHDEPAPHFFAPVLIMVVQGKKMVRIGNDDYHYGENICFISGVDMPITSCVMEASEEKPYLSLSLYLDVGLIAELATKIIAPAMLSSEQNYEVGQEEKLYQSVGHDTGASVQVVEPELLDAFVRLTELTQKPNDIPILGDLLLREIHYRLLLSPFGAMLRSLNSVGTQNNQITKAVAWLKDNYKDTISVDELAARSNMAISTFHKYFKDITTVSPLQFQKRLRLNEAQRLMLARQCDASQAALSVGYESITQFTREYKRLFGEPPRKNVMNLKQKSYEDQVGGFLN